MADTKFDLANYLSLMYQNQRRGQPYNINAVGDTSLDANEMINSINQANAQATQQLKDISGGKQEEVDDFWLARSFNTVSSMIQNIQEGILGFFDGIGDFGADIVHSLGWISESQREQFVNTDWQSWVLGLDMMNPDAFVNRIKLLQGQYSPEAARQTLENKYESSYASDWGQAGEFLRGAERSIGNMMPSILLGGLGAGAGIAQAGQQALSLGSMGLGAFSGQAHETYESTDDLGKAFLAGSLSAGVEIGTEILGDKLGLSKILGTFGKVEGSNVIAKIAKEMVGEGLEEVASGIFQPVIDSISEGLDSFKQYGDWKFWFGFDQESVLMQGVSGAFIGGILGAPSEISQTISNTKTFGKGAYEYVESYSTLQEAKSEYFKIREKYGEDSSKFKKASKKVVEATRKCSEALKNWASKGNITEAQIKNMSEFMGGLNEKAKTRVDLANEIEQKLNKVTSAVSDTNSAEFKSMFAENIKETLQDVYGNADLEADVRFGKVEGNENASIEYKSDGEMTKAVITLNSSLAKDEIVGVLAHEYIGHAITESAISKTESAKLSEDIRKSKWYESKGKQIENQYREKYKGSENIESRIDAELVGNYIQDMVSEGGEAQKNLSKRINARVLDKMASVFAKNKSVFDTADKRITKRVWDTAYEMGKRARSASSKYNQVKELLSTAEKMREKYGKESWRSKKAEKAVKSFSEKSAETLSSIEYSKEKSFSLENKEEGRKLQKAIRKLTDKGISTKDSDKQVNLYVLESELSERLRKNAKETANGIMFKTKEEILKDIDDMASDESVRKKAYEELKKQKDVSDNLTDDEISLLADFIIDKALKKTRGIVRKDKMNIEVVSKELTIASYGDTIASMLNEQLRVDYDYLEAEEQKAKQEQPKEEPKTEEEPKAEEKRKHEQTKRSEKDAKANEPKAYDAMKTLKSKGINLMKSDMVLSNYARNAIQEAMTEEYGDAKKGKLNKSSAMKVIGVARTILSEYLHENLNVKTASESHNLLESLTKEQADSIIDYICDRSFSGFEKQISKKVLGSVDMSQILEQADMLFKSKEIFEDLVDSDYYKVEKAKETVKEEPKEEPKKDIKEEPKAKEEKPSAEQEKAQEEQAKVPSKEEAKPVEEKAEKPAKQQEALYKVDDEVTHDQYGKGVVVSAQPNGIISVRFEKISKTYSIDTTDEAEAKKLSKVEKPVEKSVEKPVEEVVEKAEEKEVFNKGDKVKNKKGAIGTVISYDAENNIYKVDFDGEVKSMDGNFISKAAESEIEAQEKKPEIKIGATFEHPKYGKTTIEGFDDDGMIAVKTDFKGKEHISLVRSSVEKFMGIGVEEEVAKPTTEKEAKAKAESLKVGEWYKVDGEAHMLSSIEKGVYVFDNGRRFSTEVSFENASKEDISKQTADEKEQKLSDEQRTSLEKLQKDFFEDKTKNKGLKLSNWLRAESMMKELKVIKQGEGKERIKLYAYSKDGNVRIQASKSNTTKFVAAYIYQYYYDQSGLLNTYKLVIDGNEYYVDEKHKEKYLSRANAEEKKKIQREILKRERLAEKGITKEQKEKLKERKRGPMARPEVSESQRKLLNRTMAFSNLSKIGKVRDITFGEESKYTNKSGTSRIVTKNATVWLETELDGKTIAKIGEYANKLNAKAEFDRKEPFATITFSNKDSIRVELRTADQMKELGYKHLYQFEEEAKKKTEQKPVEKEKTAEEIEKEKTDKQTEKNKKKVKELKLKVGMEVTNPLVLKGVWTIADIDYEAGKIRFEKEGESPNTLSIYGKNIEGVTFDRETLRRLRKSEGEEKAKETKKPSEVKETDKTKKTADKIKEIREEYFDKDGIKVADKFEPFESNKAFLIKTMANMMVEGRPVSFKSSITAIEAIERYVRANAEDPNFKVDGSLSASRRLMEEWSLLPEDFRKSSIEGFVDGIFDMEKAKIEKKGLGQLYENRIMANLNESRDTLVSDLMSFMQGKSKVSNVSERLQELGSLIETLEMDNKDILERMDNKAHFDSVSKKIESSSEKVGSDHGNWKTLKDIERIFKNSITKGYSVSNESLGKFINEYISDGFEGSEIEDMLNRIQFGTADKETISELLKMMPETLKEDFTGVIESVKGYCDKLKSSYDEKASFMTNEQVSNVIEMFRDISKAIRTKEKMDIASLKAEVDKCKDDLGKALEMSAGNKLWFKGKYQKLLFNYASPDVYFAYMFGGTNSESYKKIWEDCIKEPYVKYLEKKMELLVEFDQDGKGYAKRINDNCGKKIKVLDSNGIETKIRKQVLYSYYLNTLSSENMKRMDNKTSEFLVSEGNYKTSLSRSVLDSEISKLTQEEKSDLDSLFRFYNEGKLKEYVSGVMETNIGSEELIKDYYPLLNKEAMVDGDTYSNHRLSMMMNPSVNARMKERVSTRVKLELNVNPVTLMHQYIESMTTTGEMGIPMRRFSRLMTMPGKDGLSVMNKASEFMPDTRTFVEFTYRQALGLPLKNGKENVVTKLIGRASVSALGINLRATVKQVGSLFTAWNKTGMRNPFKAFGKSVFSKGLKKRAMKNPVFRARVYDNGFVRGMTLSTQELGSRFNKIVMAPLEFMDKQTCYMTYSMCEESVKRLNPDNDIASEDMQEQVSKMFSDVIMETQSNSDRIMMSRIRSGDAGNLAKVLFGMFASDQQNKVSLFMKSAVDNDYARRSGNKVMLADSRKKMGVYFASILASGLIAIGANRLFDALFGNRDWDEFIIDTGDAKSMINDITELASETATSWIPYFNTFVSWLTYGEVSYMPLENLDDLMSSLNDLMENGMSRRTITNIAMSTSMYFGLPAKNFRNVLLAFFAFVPDMQFKMKNILYGFSQQYIGKEIKSALEQGKTNKASSLISLQYSSYKTPISDYISGEIARLRKAGYDVQVHSIPKKIGEDSISDKDRDQFSSFYSGLSSDLDSLVGLATYSKMGDEGKNNAIRRLSDAWYEASMAMITGEEPKGRLAKLVYAGGKIAKYVSAMSSIDKTKGKSYALSQVNKLRLTRQEKLLVMWLLGYGVSDENKNQLIRSLYMIGIPMRSAKAIVD